MVKSEFRLACKPTSAVCELNGLGKYTAGFEFQRKVSCTGMDTARNLGLSSLQVDLSLSGDTPSGMGELRHLHVMAEISEERKKCVILPKQGEVETD